MKAAEKLIQIARAEIGYLEKTSNKDLDSKTANAGSANYTKYARDLYPSLQGQAWCDMFVDWCHVQAFGRVKAMQLIGGGFSAYTPTSAQYYKNKGRWYTSPEPGDQIFFKNSVRICHTGIVIRVAGDRVYTIEGNTSGASGVVANGGGVCEKSYALSYAGIAGYGRPDWSLVEEPGYEPGWHRDGNGWWYQNADGTWPAMCWKMINHHWYLFGASGYMLTGWVQWDGEKTGTGDWYYLEESGEFQGACWHENEKGKGGMERWYVA